MDFFNSVYGFLAGPKTIQIKVLLFDVNDPTNTKEFVLEFIFSTSSNIELQKFYNTLIEQCVPFNLFPQHMEFTNVFLYKDERPNKYSKRFDIELFNILGLFEKDTFNVLQIPCEKIDRLGANTTRHLLKVETFYNEQIIQTDDREKISKLQNELQKYENFKKGVPTSLSFIQRKIQDHLLESSLRSAQTRRKNEVSKQQFQQSSGASGVSITEVEPNEGREQISELKDLIGALGAANAAKKREQEEKLKLEVENSVLRERIAEQQARQEALLSRDTIAEQQAEQEVVRAASGSSSETPLDSVLKKLAEQQELINSLLKSQNAGASAGNTGPARRGRGAAAAAVIQTEEIRRPKKCTYKGAGKRCSRNCSGNDEFCILHKPEEPEDD